MNLLTKKFLPKEQPLLTVLPDSDVPTSGVMAKPPGCARCAYKSIGAGFCPDYVPPSPRIAIWLEAPGQDEILYREPLYGRAGQAWVRQLIRPLGYEKEDCIIVNSLRCRTRGDGRPKDQYNDYPTGRIRTHAEELCRQYDDMHGEEGRLVPGGLYTWNPTVFLITLHPATLLRSSAPTRLVRKQVEKAFQFATEGERPCVLMGDKAAGIIAPWAHGGVKKWNGHWWYGSLPKK